ncbi:hypothetical protein BJV74DRAFT_799772 [Russula compacta]|nr:hypothetical protein BJV74DRAFT_799772 [Russula compacta]
MNGASCRAMVNAWLMWMGVEMARAESRGQGKPPGWGWMEEVASHLLSVGVTVSHPPSPQQYTDPQKKMLFINEFMGLACWLLIWVRGMNREAVLWLGINVDAKTDVCPMQDCVNMNKRSNTNLRIMIWYHRPESSVFTGAQG